MLFRSCVMMGVATGEVGAGVRQTLSDYGAALGLAFQVVDDILDVTADSAVLGKTAGKDAQQGKPTYVSAMGLARAKEFAEELRVEAMRSLEGFGERALRLRQLADFIVLRKF